MIQNICNLKANSSEKDTESTKTLKHGADRQVLVSVFYSVTRRRELVWSVKYLPPSRVGISQGSVEPRLQ